MTTRVPALPIGASVATRPASPAGSGSPATGPASARSSAAGTEVLVPIVAATAIVDLVAFLVLRRIPAA